jgi:hypothetical protein
MQQPPFAQDRARQRSLQRPAILEIRTGADKHVGRDARAPKGLIGKSATAPFRGRVIRDDEEQVIVTVRTGVAAGDRSEQIQSIRLIRRD